MNLLATRLFQAIVFAILYKQGSGLSSEDSGDPANQPLPLEDETSHQRELFRLRDGALRDCIGREIVDFNDQFDPVAYRDLIFSEAGVTVEQLKELHKKNKDTFQETPEYRALIGAVENRKTELQELSQIVEACQEEVEGARSAVGAGAMVGALLARAMEGPIDGALTSNGEQIKDSPAPAPTDVPIIRSTTSPTFSTVDFPWRFPIQVGIHLEIEYGVVSLTRSSFVGGGKMFCLSGVFLSPFGAEASIVVIVYAGIPNVDTTILALMLGIDAGFGINVGVAAGLADGCFSWPTFPFFEFTIGAGINLLSIEPSLCKICWDPDDNCDLFEV
jgi:hypothetical protein